MNFLDLSAASEDERRLIREILSDTSITESNQAPQQPSNSVVSSNPPSTNSSISTSSRNNISCNNNSTTSSCSNNSSSNINSNNNSSSSISSKNNSNNNNNINKTTITSTNVNTNTNLPSVNSTTNDKHANNLNAKNIESVEGTILQSSPQAHIQVQTSKQHQQHSTLSNQLPRSLKHGQDRSKMANMPSHTNGNVVANSASAIASPMLDQHLSGTPLPMNMYNNHPAHIHRVPSAMPTSKLEPKNNISMKNQPYYPPQYTSTNMPQQPSSASGTQPAPPSPQMPQMAGDMNSVIAMDMTSPRPQGYAIPPSVPPYAHPQAAHMYGGHPLFQHYPHPYLIPYNMTSFVHPYVLPPNSVVPSRVVQTHTNQTMNANTNNVNSSPQSRSQSSHLSPQQRSHESFSNNSNTRTNHSLVEQVEPQNKYQDLSEHAQKLDLMDQQSDETVNNHTLTKNYPAKAEVSEKSSSDMSSPSAPSEIPTMLDVLQESGHTELDPSEKSKSTSNTKGNNYTTKSVTSKIKKVPPPHRNDRLDNQTSKTDVSSSVVKNNQVKAAYKPNQQASDQSNSVPSIPVKNDDQIKSSSDEGFDTQSSLDMSKQSHESSIATNEQSKSSHANESGDDFQSGTRNMDDNKLDEKQNKSNGAWSSSSKSWADLFKREGNTGLDTNCDTEKRSLNSENSDDDDKTRVPGTSKPESSVKISTLVTNSKELRSQESAKRALDKTAPRLAQKINAISLKHSLPFLKPRGFINKGNGCYINATLQALIACPPFYNLMKEIGDLKCSRRDNSCTPIIDSFAELFLNFPPLDAGKKGKQIASADQKMNINSLQAESIEPKCIYNVLGQIKSECLKGAQEDAEEFLSSVLNGLHEEMAGLLELLQTPNGNQNGIIKDIDDSNDDIQSDENLWREVGPKNRSLPIRTAKVVNTPIQEIFGGSLFSIRTAGKDRCGHRSPFFDLQLDISGDNVKSVQDAIKSFTAPEIINDFYCSKTKQKLDAQRRTSLDQLPPILILHLKQFVYSQDQGLKKLMKRIEYPIDFELPDNCLHEKSSTEKNLRNSRSYKLLAVVYHDGREAVKGHYLTDVYHIGSSQWIRCDDSNLKVIQSPRIENPDSTRTPYLLFYRRLNTLRAQSGNHDNKKKS